jgi:hypothetical protein
MTIWNPLTGAYAWMAGSSWECPPQLGEVILIEGVEWIVVEVRQN